MPAGGGGGSTWPGPFRRWGAGRRQALWPGTSGREPGEARHWPGEAPPWSHWPRWQQWPRWLRIALLLLCGGIIGAFITIALLVFAGPRPAPIPPHSGVGDVQITVDDAYLTAAVRQAASGVPVVGGISKLTVHAVPGDRLLLAGTSNEFGVSTPVSMVLQPLARHGDFTVHVLESRIGGMPLPGFLDAQVENAINQQVANLGQSALSGSPPYVVTGVTTTYGHITLTLGPAA